MTMSNPLELGTITRIHAPLNQKLHKIRVPVTPNLKLFLIQMMNPFWKLSPDSGISKRRLADDYKGMLIS